MKAFQITAPGATQVIDRPLPIPGVGEALLRVRCVGICGTDLNSFRGANPLVAYPRVPGHEIGAVVEQLPEGASSDLHVGQEVLVIPYNNCGHCAACRQGRFNTCRENHTLGVQREGAMCEFFAVPSEKLLANPKLSLRELALVEPLTVGFHACARGRIETSDTTAVLGSGTIGLGAIAGAAYRGSRVIAVDVDDRKLELARLCGAAETINSQTESLHDRIQELTDGHGADVVIEAIGLPSTFRSAVEEVSFAGRVVYIGYAKAPVEYETKWFVLKELDILGSRNAGRDDFAVVMEMLEQKCFPVDAVVSRTVSIEEAGDALIAWDKAPSEVTKIQVAFA